MTRGELRAAHGELREMVGGGWLHLKRGAVTDDTEMSLCLAESIVARGALDLEGAAARLAGWD